MGCFERRLQIAPYHTLVQVRTHGCGGRTPFLRWVHREYDRHGLPIARYDTVQMLEPGRFRICSWRKFDIAGRLMETGTFAHLDDAPFDET
jgi:hypothetical protein